jgi:hypothetical protein
VFPYFLSHAASKYQKSNLNFVLFNECTFYSQCNWIQLLFIVILDQEKNPKWHEAMIAAHIDIFDMSYEESAKYFKQLENL